MCEPKEDERTNIISIMIPMEDPLELTRQLNREPNIPVALAILTWELGDLQKCITHNQWFPGLTDAYYAEAKKALGAILFQSIIIAKLLGTSLEESIQSGYDEIKDRINQRKNGEGYVGESKQPK